MVFLTKSFTGPNPNFVKLSFIRILFVLFFSIFITNRNSCSLQTTPASSLCAKGVSCGIGLCRLVLEKVKVHLHWRNNQAGHSLQSVAVGAGAGGGWGGLGSDHRGKGALLFNSVRGVGRGSVQEARGAGHPQVHASVAVAVHAVADGVVAGLLGGAAGDVPARGHAAGVSAVAHLVVPLRLGHVDG